MIGFIFFVLQGLLSVIVWALIISAILSWLVAFNVINTRNPAMFRIMDALERFTAPILAPFRALIPPFGGFDISFIVCLLVIQGMKIYLLPIAERNLYALLG